jgi:hypothetical protein
MMKLDVIDFARRVGISVDEANKWLEEYHIEVEVLLDIAYDAGYGVGYKQGYDDGFGEE